MRKNVFLEREIPVVEEADVVVIGNGPSCFLADVAASCENAIKALMERGGHCISGLQGQLYNK